MPWRRRRVILSRRIGLRGVSVLFTPYYPSIYTVKVFRMVESTSSMLEKALTALRKASTTSLNAFNMFCKAFDTSYEAYVYRKAV
jgi:hypothetical protein